MKELTHLNSAGEAHMVDVTGKSPTIRQASAQAEVTCSPATIKLIRSGAAPKGDVLAVARIAGISATKQVPALLPLAHVIGIHGAQVDIELGSDRVIISTQVRTADRTGVEMEALTAATVAALAFVDMVKGVDRCVAISRAFITAKSGGRSGDWSRPQTPLGAFSEADE